MIDFERSKLVKEAAVMPSLTLSPFLPLNQQSDEMQNSLFMESKQNNDLSVLEPQQSVIHKYIVELI